jgi:hypothetical protein
MLSQGAQDLMNVLHMFYPNPFEEEDVIQTYDNKIFVIPQDQALVEIVNMFYRLVSQVIIS